LKNRREFLLYEQFRHGLFRVVAYSGRYGIRPGMPLAEATALGNVECQEHDPLADRTALLRLAGWCEQFGPIVGIEEPDNLLVDISGLGPLFAGEERLAEQVVRAFQQLGLTARVAIADTVGTAWALAHFGKQFPIVIPPGNTALALAELPIAALRLSPSIFELLAELGLAQIGQLQSLPREALAARFDPQLMLRLDQTMGEVAEPIVSHRPPPEMAAQVQLEDPITNRVALEQVLAQLLEEISRQLTTRQQGAIQLECRLQGETRQQTKLLIGLFRASAQPRHLLELARMQLERLVLPGPISVVSLAVLTSAPLSSWQPELFENKSRREIRHQAALLIDRLSNRLGRASVVQALSVPDAQPEFAFRYEPLTGVVKPSPRGEGRVRGKRQFGHGLPTVTRRQETFGRNRVQGQETGAQRSAIGERIPLLHRHRPVRLQREPAALEVVSVVPHGPPIQFYLHGTWQRVAHAWGPERIQTGWWRGRYIQRDYYRVETTTGARFWVFRRLSDETWFLQGVFD
jgi:protein ImuB